MIMAELHTGKRFVYTEHLLDLWINIFFLLRDKNYHKVQLCTKIITSPTKKKKEKKDTILIVFFHIRVRFNLVFRQH